MNRFITFFFTLALTLSCLQPAQANKTRLDMDTFSKLPIQHEGRIKPMESFARNLGYRLNGSKYINNLSATDFLAEALFNPPLTTIRPVFEIRRQELKQLLELDTKQTYFSMAEIIPALQKRRDMIASVTEKKTAEQSSGEKDLLTLYDNAILLKSVVTSMQMILPLRIEIPAEVASELEINATEIKTYMDIKRYEEKLSNYFKDLPVDQVTEHIQAFVLQLSMIENNTDTQNIFRIMPPEWPLNQSPEWNSPWALINMGLSGPKSAQYFNEWKNMANAYRMHDAEAWKNATEQAYEKVIAFPKTKISEQKLSLELIYLHLTPYFYSLIFYLLALALTAIMLAKPQIPTQTLALTTVLTGLLFHCSAIVMRILILERPPVSTLYESVIFVSAICVLAAVITSLLHKEKTLCLFMAALAGAILYFVAEYLAKEGDTLQVLTAVLNTNFWLATHVIVITAGYGFCILTGLLAHYGLYRRAITRSAQTNIVSLVLVMSLISLLLTAVGTILGGIWADQSWGRFWGWDPKENGALLIVLWLVWAIHGKIAGQLRELGFLVVSSFVIIIVALAWFGVNLLNVGLHSYGFISGIAISLTLFCVIEIIIISTPALIIQNRKRHVS